MARKTEGVNQLVIDILATIDQPYSEDITLEVFRTIETTPEWRQRYDELCNELGKWSVNTSTGKYVKEITGRQLSHQVETDACKLIGSYSKLR